MVVGAGCYSVLIFICLNFPLSKSPPGGSLDEPEVGTHGRADLQSLCQLIILGLTVWQELWSLARPGHIPIPVERVPWDKPHKKRTWWKILSHTNLVMVTNQPPFNSDQRDGSRCFHFWPRCGGATCNPSTQEAEVGGSWVQVQAGLHSQTLSLKEKTKSFFFFWFLRGWPSFS
jgi:hypothetical protein